MTAQEVLDDVVLEVQAAVSREARRDVKYTAPYEWSYGSVRFTMHAAENGEIHYQVNGSPPARITRARSSYDASTVADVARSVKSALRVEMPTDAELDAEAYGRLKRCKRCGDDISLMSPEQDDRPGSSIVQWDVRCPNCRHKNWIDMRPKASAMRSPFYRPSRRRHGR